jgi:hypothetical protein
VSRSAELSLNAVTARPGFVTERFKSFRGAQPPRKLRWTNAKVFGGVYGKFAQCGAYWG